MNYFPVINFFKALALVILLIFVKNYGFAQGKIFTVINTNISGAGSLKAAIDSVNANPTDPDSKHQILVSSSLSSPYTITLSSALPNIIEPVIIDGKINAVSNLIIDGNTGNIKGLTIRCDYVEVKNVKFKNFDFGSNSRGIQVDSNFLVIDSCRFETCYYGVYLNGNSNVVKHSSFSGFTTGIGVAKNDNVIFPRNIISNPDKTGTGILISSNAMNNRVGGEITSSDSMNILSGLNIAISDAGKSTKIFGNLIGGPSKLSSGSCSGQDYGGSNTTGILLLNNYAAEVGKVGQANDNFANVILGYGKGIYVDDGDKNSIAGNYIGVDKFTCTPAGTIFTQSDQNGIDIKDISDSNFVGSTVVPHNEYDANVIAGMPDGIGIWYRSGGVGNSIQGNIIGTDRNSQDNIGNKTGILVFGTTLVTISGNVVSKSSGVGISVSNKTIIENNKIGTTVDGTGIRANNSGVSISGSGAKGTIVRNNLISGNSTGINIQTDSNTVTGNLIGTNSSGDSLVSTGSQTNGVRIGSGSGNIIGGDDPAKRNIISGNVYGVYSVSGAGIENRIIGNYIGTDPAGVYSVKNSNYGIWSATKKLIIGGNSLLGEGNIISGNSGGIYFNNCDSSAIKGNIIGLNSAGSPLPNDSRGISIRTGSSDNIVGGTNPGEANIIAHHSEAGVYLLNSTSINNKISGNSIYGNSVKAIDLNYGTNQGNNGKTVPVIDSIKYFSPTEVLIKGTSEANDSIEVFSGEPTGKSAYVYIGKGKADGSGKWSVLAGVSALDKYYVASATSQTNNTSELSSAKAGSCYYFALDTRNVYPASYDVSQGSSSLGSSFISGINGTGAGQVSVNPVIPSTTSVIEIRISESDENDSLRLYFDVDKNLNISNLKSKLESFDPENLGTEHYSIDTNSAGCDALVFYSEPQYPLPHSITSNLLNGIYTNNSFELSGLKGMEAEIKVYVSGDPVPLTTLTNGGSYEDKITWSSIPAAGLYKFVLKITDSSTPSPKVLYYKGQFLNN